MHEQDSGKPACRQSALAVGVLLIAINHGSALLHGGLTAERLLAMGLTVMVPYCVSTMSSVGAMLEARAGQPNAQPVQHGDPPFR